MKQLLNMNTWKKECGNRSFALSNEQEGKNKKQAFDYFNNGAQYTMGIEWIDYHLASTHTEFITYTSNNEYSWKYFLNVTTPWLFKGVATSTMKMQLNPFPHGFQTKNGGNCDFSNLKKLQFC